MLRGRRAASSYVFRENDLRTREQLGVVRLQPRASAAGPAEGATLRIIKSAILAALFLVPLANACNTTPHEFKDSGGGDTATAGSTIGGSSGGSSAGSSAGRLPAPGRPSPALNGRSSG